MNDAFAPLPASGFGHGAGSDGPSAGTLLRLAREQAGLQVDTLAAALKVPVLKLEALEADRFDLLPDAVFGRALAASICRTLKIDPAPVLGRLPVTTPQLAPRGVRINTPFRSPRDGAGPSWRDQLSRPRFIAVVALLLAALVVALLPSRHEDTEAVTPLPATEPVLAVLPASGTDTAAPAPGAAATAATGPGAATGMTLKAASGVTVGTAPAAVASPPAVPPAPVAAGIVVFKAKAGSWVQVTDARGGVPLRKLLAAGESAAVSGPVPLSVTVGSASTTEVEVRGKPFDLAPLTRDDVARFEVK